MITKCNPATLEPIGSLPETDPAEMPSRVERARAAMEEWTSWPLSRRVRAVKDAQLYIMEHVEDIARVVSSETGKPKVEAIDVDLLTSLTAGDFAARSMRSLFAPKRVPFDNLFFLMRYMGRSSYIQRRPVGVVGIITPWNYPFGMPYSQAVMAVAAGNAVILKPSSEAPFSGLEVGKVFEQGDFPKDLVQVVVGSGSTVGRALICSGVDRLVFTGSSAAGTEIMAQAAQRLTPVTLELGGKDPFVVFDDADIARAVDAAVWGSFVNAGQTCACVKRIYLQNGIYDRFVSLMKEKVGGLRLGNGWDDPDVCVGPVINEGALREMEAMVSRAVEDGGHVLIGGRRAPGLKGFFFEPTLIEGLPQHSPVVQEEAFGPLVCVLRFRTEEEAVRLANDCPYALSGSVWTRDLVKGRRVAERLSGGTVLVNNVAYTYGLAMTPWGGRGLSGFGRTHGRLGLEELTEPHHVHVDTGRIKREVWWHPYDRRGLEAGKALFDLLYGRRFSRRLSALLKLRRAMKGR